ncbi:mas-related G-protein coupled receptor member H-like [Melozone crissalis]|uniref:mas-related G-protein coupled receptor member H-like n=1 Tax=Melozone crissalis TaxID=40204 RepID=UPI0023DBE46A|nr:mas-related G-protein coupled receptor member H-like [Melozone crissalis]
MEVTTVSPSPASPTEGDDLCETDVTTVATHSVTLLICLCGLAGNAAVLWLLGSCCSSRSSTILYIFMITLLDFFFLLILLPATVLFLVGDVSCSNILPLSYIRFLFWMSLFSYSLWLCTLTFISIKRCRSIHCPLWFCCHHPQQMLNVMLALLRAFSVTLIIDFAMMLPLCIFEQPDFCRVSLSSIHAFNLVLGAPFMLISSIILFTHFKPGSQQQQPKKLDIVICLILLFSLPLSLCNFLQELSYTTVPSKFFFLLTCINSSIKPFIYILVGRCWRPCSVWSLRLSLQRVFD